MKVLNLGSLNIDYVYQVDQFLLPGETKHSGSYSIHCGGKGLNQSIAVAKAGLPVCHAGVIGSDGGILRDCLEQNGVDTSLLQSVPQRNGHAIIQVDAKGQNCILLHGGTNQMLTEDYIDQALAQCAKEDVVLLQNETNSIDYILDQAHRLGLRVACNAAPMDSKVPGYPLEKLTWLIVNEIEGAQLAGCDSADENAILDRLTARYPHLGILLTLGKRGAVYWEKGNLARFGIFDVPVVDTTAAGDTFTGYFLYGMMQNLGVDETLRLATAASTLCVGKAGAADSVPLLAQVREALASGTLGAPKEA